MLTKDTCTLLVLLFCRAVLEAQTAPEGRGEWVNSYSKGGSNIQMLQSYEKIKAPLMPG
jgi:hypothetical protein